MKRRYESLGGKRPEESNDGTEDENKEEKVGKRQCSNASLASIRAEQRFQRELTRLLAECLGVGVIGHGLDPHSHKETAAPDERVPRPRRLSDRAAAGCDEDRVPVASVDPSQQGIQRFAELASALSLLQVKVTVAQTYLTQSYPDPHDACSFETRWRFQQAFNRQIETSLTAPPVLERVAFLAVSCDSSDNVVHLKSLRSVWHLLGGGASESFALWVKQHLSTIQSAVTVHLGKDVTTIVLAYVSMPAVWLA